MLFILLFYLRNIGNISEIRKKMTDFVKLKTGLILKFLSFFQKMNRLFIYTRKVCYSIFD